MVEARQVFSLIHKLYNEELGLSATFKEALVAAAVALEGLGQEEKLTREVLSQLYPSCQAERLRLSPQVPVGLEELYGLAEQAANRSRFWQNLGKISPTSFR